MTYRIHTTDASELHVQVGTETEIADELGSYDVDEPDATHLLLNDLGNQEAMVVTGDADAIIGLSNRIAVQALHLGSQNLEVAKRHVTKGIRDFFRAEWSNERNGGVSPATLYSAIDSLHQGGLEFFTMLTPDDVVRLLYIRDLLPGSLVLTKITPDDGSTD